MKIVFDSNIVIDFLNGIPEATKEMKSYVSPIISIVTYIEVLAGAREKKNPSEVTKFLINHFDIKEVNFDIANTAIEIRKNSKFKLPDAIIYATALIEDALLITRNSKDFSIKDPRVKIPYKI